MSIIKWGWAFLLGHFIFSSAHTCSTSNNADPIVITANWSTVDYLLHTTPSLQIVTNPLVSRQFSPISKQIFSSLEQLHAEYTRFAAWFPYPKMAVAELDPPSGLFQCGNAGEGYFVHLSCEQSGGVISSIDFASYGTATGACGQMKQGTCHSTNSLDIVQKACLNQQECSVPASYEIFGDPCKPLFVSSIEFIKHPFFPYYRYDLLIISKYFSFPLSPRALIINDILCFEIVLL